MMKELLPMLASFSPLLVICAGLILFLLWDHYRYTWEKVPFKGIATVTSHKYVPRRRSGAMVHSTTPAKYLIRYKTAEFEYYINSYDLYDMLRDGDQFELEGTITYKYLRKNPTVRIFHDFNRDKVRKV